MPGKQYKTGGTAHIIAMSVSERVLHGGQHKNKKAVLYVAWIDYLCIEMLVR